MISSKINEPDRVLIKQRELTLKKHYQKLESIRNTESKPALSKSFIHRSKKTFNIEQKIEINRTNKILLSKINHIVQRKPDLSKSASNIHKSLNLNLRKKFSYKINEENEKIASRLKSQKALMPKKKFEDEFLLHQKYKNQLSKRRLFKYQETMWGKASPVGKKSFTPTLKRNLDEIKMESARGKEFDWMTSRVGINRFIDEIL
jgi:hypothetical protein